MTDEYCRIFAPPRFPAAGGIGPTVGLSAIADGAARALEEFEAAQDEIQPALEEKFGSLEPETADVQRFLESECGLTSDS